MFRWLSIALAVCLAQAARAEDVPVWRLGDPSGDAFFLTSSCEEAESAQVPVHLYMYGVRFWISNWQDVGTEPFYRFFSSTTKKHFYTKSANAEGDASYVEEGKLGYIYSAPGRDRVPLLRLYRPVVGTHAYVTSTSERDLYIDLGYKYEMIAGYVMGKGPPPSCIPRVHLPPPASNLTPPACKWNEDNCGQPR